MIYNGSSLSLCLWIFLNAQSAYRWLPVLTALAQCALLLTVWKTEQPALLDPLLKKVAILTLLCSLLLAFTS